MPLQLPEATHDIALVLDQLSVDEPPLTTVEGVADSATDGGEGTVETVTVTDCAALPPGPVQVSVKFVVAVSAVRTSLPPVALVPLHPPLAVQLVALVDDQLSVDDPPLTTVVGFAVSVTEGGDGCVTVTLTDCVADPPTPLHVSANAELADKGPVEADPDVALVPLQLPDATQLVALVEDHVSVAAPPATTDGGETDSETDGDGTEATTFAVTVWPAVPPAPEQFSE